TDAPAAGRDPRHLPRRDPQDPVGRTAEWFPRAAALAHDHPTDAQGLDRAEGSRWQEDRRFLALPPSAVLRNGREARSRQAARSVDEELQARRTLRCYG